MKEENHTTDTNTRGENSAQSTCPPLQQALRRNIRPAWRAKLLQTYPSLVFLLPFFVFMLSGSFEPHRPPEIPPEERTPFDDIQEDSWFGLNLEYSHYPIVYTSRIALTLLTIWFVWPGYREFKWSISFWSVLVGVVGIVVWVGVCKLGIEQRVFEAVGLAEMLGVGERVGYNPFEELAGQPAAMYAFLAVRFFGLVVLVALIEEMLLRGWLLRYVTDPDWQTVAFGTGGRAVIVTTIVYSVLTHPGEMLAAAIWFSMVTWLTIRTRSVLDCIVAHATTNLLLGVYVIASGDWYFW